MNKQMLTILTLSTMGIAGCMVEMVKPPHVRSAQPRESTAESDQNKDIFQKGKASFYGKDFAGKTTANGETFDPQKLTAAHKTLPFGCMVKVGRLDSDKSVTVRINDRGPFVKGRVIDLSRAAAQKLGIVSAGVATVELITLNKCEKKQK